jgi:hypothetical protein
MTKMSSRQAKAPVMTVVPRVALMLQKINERYSKPHVIEKKKSARAASNASG